MVTGRSMQLTKQVGEYLVAAELCRRKLIATTFTGNVPDYDIVAILEGGESALIQVKAIRGGLWQFGDARKFLDIKQQGKQQIPGRTIRAKYPNLVYVFVLLESYGRDRFFVLRGSELHQLVARHYRANLKRLGGIRPRRQDSYHAGLGVDDLGKYEDGWDIIGQTATGPAN